MKKTGFVGSLEYKKHQTGLGHPESTRRIDAVLNAIEAAKLDLQKIEPRMATKEELQFCHMPDYIAIAERDVASGTRQLSTGDTTISKDSYRTALLASGGILAAVDAVVGG
ncbi:MAG TPA: histone deacetylase, partial [Verrucomicrobiae bacterium]